MSVRTQLDLCAFYSWSHECLLNAAKADKAVDLKGGHDVNRQVALELVRAEDVCGQYEPTLGLAYFDVTDKVFPLTAIQRATFAPQEPERTDTEIKNK